MQDTNDPFCGRNQIQASKKYEYGGAGPINLPEMPGGNGNDTPWNQAGTDQCQDKRCRTCLDGLEPLASDEMGKTGCHSAGRAGQPGEISEGTRWQPQLSVSSEALRAGCHENRQAKSTDERQTTDCEHQSTGPTNRVARRHR